MCCFIGWLPWDVGFEMGLEADAVIWSSHINPANAWGLVAGFEDCSWKFVLFGNVVGLGFETRLYIKV